MKLCAVSNVRWLRIRPTARLTVHEDKATLASDVADNLSHSSGRSRAMYDLHAYSLESAQVGLVEWAGQSRGRRAEALHKEGDTEGVEPLAHEELGSCVRNMCV